MTFYAHFNSDSLHNMEKKYIYCDFLWLRSQFQLYYSLFVLKMWMQVKESAKGTSFLAFKIKKSNLFNFSRQFYSCGFEFGTV